MNYLEITILFLFIGFLIVFYLSNFIYNKCISEKTQESFMDAQAKASLLAKQQALAAEQAAVVAKQQQLAAENQKKESTRLQAVRATQRASNKLVSDKWDNTRNSQFGKFNSYAQSISSNSEALNAQVDNVSKIHRGYNTIPDGRAAGFSDSTPVQLNKLKTKIMDFYTENKKHDGRFANVATRITAVNNILAA